MHKGDGAQPHRLSSVRPACATCTLDHHLSVIGVYGLAYAVFGGFSRPGTAGGPGSARSSQRTSQNSALAQSPACFAPNALARACLSTEPGPPAVPTSVEGTSDFCSPRMPEHGAMPARGGYTVRKIPGLACRACPRLDNARCTPK